MIGAPIKLLYVITDLEVGGVPLHLHRLALAMRDRGFSPSVVCLGGDGAVADRLRHDGVTVHTCRGRGGWDFRVLGRLAGVMADVQPDVVHALLFHANVAARLCARWASIPPDRVICEIQTVELKRRWHLAVDRWSHRGCRVTIGNSPSVIDHLAGMARIPRSRLRLVRGGIDGAPLREAAAIERTSLGVGDHDPIVLWTGRLDPVKGLSVLLKAFASVHRQTGAHLMLAGGGSLRGSLSRQISRLRLEHSAHLLGVRDDIMALLKTADLFVFPSSAEGLPNALLEAMAARCPIVATDVPGCRDLIEHEKTGLLVRYGDTDALAAAIVRLLRDRHTADRLAVRAAKVVERDWSIRATLDAYESIYREIGPRT